MIVEPGVRTGVPVLTDNPKEVGADRIVNTLAAHHLFGGPCIVVDFGTSTNLDVVSARGEFLGGALAPGIEISLDALAARAAQLRKVELVLPALGDRQEHRRGAAVRRAVRLRRPGRRPRRPDHRRARRRRRRRSSPPAGWPRSWSASRARSPTTSPTSPCSDCAWSTSAICSPDASLPVALRAMTESPTPASAAAGPGADDLPEQMRIRREKLARLRAEGVDPYPVGFPRTTSLADLREAHADLGVDVSTGERVGRHRPGRPQPRRRQALLRHAARRRRRPAGHGVARLESARSRSPRGRPTSTSATTSASRAR